MKPNIITPALASLACSLATVSVSSAAAIIYDTAGSVYSQNFNSIPGRSGATDNVNTTPGWTNGTTLTGWHGTQIAIRNNQIETSNGQSSTLTSGAGTLTSMGTNGSSDSALGFQNGNNGTPLFLAGQLQNTTGSTLNQFTLGVTAEQWRRINVVSGTAEGQLTATFDYQVFASGAGSLNAASGWTTAPALNFSSVSTAGSNTGIDGNASGNRTVIAPQTVALSWGDTQELWVRWTYASLNSNPPTRQMVGIDDLTFTAAVPEPAA